MATVSLSVDSTCAITPSRGVKCWGANYYGQLGNDSLTESLVPVDVVRLSDVQALSSGSGHTCALTMTGAVKCWGENRYLQLGDGTSVDRTSPTAVPGLESGVKAIAAGGGHTCALRSDRTVVCWGYNGDGQLGNGDNVSRSAPTAVTQLGSDIIDISAGAFHTCALTAGGAVKCWGYNDFGQLGNNSLATLSVVPVDVASLYDGVVQISAGRTHTCAIQRRATDADNLVKCWGGNQWGQLAIDPVANPKALVPREARGTRGATNVFTGERHTCVTPSGGQVHCWGYNGEGQLGNKSKDEGVHDWPTLVQGDQITGVTLLPRGNTAFDMCAMTAGAGLQCWGYNRTGQLGNNSRITSLTPTRVVGF